MNTDAPSSRQGSELRIPLFSARLDRHFSVGFDVVFE